MAPPGAHVAALLLLLLGPHAAVAAAGAAGAPPPGAPIDCVAALQATSSACSSTLNRANSIAYQRLDRVMGQRGNSAFRLDAGRFFRLAVGMSQDSGVKVPAACCAAAVPVLSKQWQDACACRPEVSRFTRDIDRELLDYWALFLGRSCELAGAPERWAACGGESQGLVSRVQEATFPIPDFVDKLTSAGRAAVAAGMGAATGAARAAAGAATSAAGAAAGAVGGVLTGAVGGAAGAVGGAAGALPMPFGRRRALQEADKCTPAGEAARVAQNNASAAFYFLCPDGKGHCGAGGKCVLGRSAPVQKGEWATCAPLAGCADAPPAAGGGGGGGGGGERRRGCFPAAATVVTPGGAAKRMDELAIGDKVLAASPDGSLGYEDVYFFGHQDAGVSAAFVSLALAGGRRLALTHDHFVPVLRSAAGAAAAGAGAAAAGAGAAAAGSGAGEGAGAGGRLAAAQMVYASEVRVGDVLLAAAAGAAGGAGPWRLEAAPVAAVALEAAPGLFNPYTLGGTIVVDGVLASAHSGWLVDGLLAAAGAPGRVPGVLQALFAPLRALYRAAGPAAMRRVGGGLAGAGLRLEAALLGGGGGRGGSTRPTAAEPAPAALASGVAVMAAAAAATAAGGAALRKLRRRA